MDQTKYQEIVEYLTNTSYPKGATKKQKYVIRRRAIKFEIRDGVLYHINTTKDGLVKKAEVISSVSKANDIFKDFHSSPHGAHCSIKKTTDAITSCFYWPGMTVDIEKWVSECKDCQKEGLEIKAKQVSQPIMVSECKKGLEIKAKQDLQPITVTGPWELLGMDLIGKMTKTKNDKQYICTIVDYYTKWSIAYSLKSKSPLEVVQCIVQLFSQFGAPKRIITDQSTEFCNKINEGICKYFEIKTSCVLPYHPQTNGLVEKLNGTVQRSVRKLVQDEPNTWDNYLDAVIFYLNTKKTLTTKYTPFFMLYGREARDPLEDPPVFQYVSKEKRTECFENTVHNTQSS